MRALQRHFSKPWGPTGFRTWWQAAAGDVLLDPFDLRRGALALLPLLATGPVATTNFDRLLERAFEANGAAFDSVISGPRPDLIVDALHGDRHVLIKLHGDWQDRVGRTFARSDYDTNYGKSQPERRRELLDSAERLLFSCRSLLFIGASLGPDRTVRLLQEVHRNNAGVRHPNAQRRRGDRQAMGASIGSAESPKATPHPSSTTWIWRPGFRTCFPRLQRTLSAQPLLFLGSGLAAHDIESVVRFAHRAHPGPRSWAVVRLKGVTECWRQNGVEIMDQEVGLYVTELHHRLSAAVTRRA